VLTPSGRRLSDADIDAVAAKVATKDCDVEAPKTRRRGRPTPAEVVPVRIDPELRAALEARAKADNTTTSEVIRGTLRRLLDVA